MQGPLSGEAQKGVDEGRAVIIQRISLVASDWAHASFFGGSIPPSAVKSCKLAAPPPLHTSYEASAYAQQSFRS